MNDLQENEIPVKQASLGVASMFETGDDHEILVRGWIILRNRLS